MAHLFSLAGPAGVCLSRGSLAIGVTSYCAGGAGPGPLVRDRPVRAIASRRPAAAGREPAGRSADAAPERGSCDDVCSPPMHAKL
jgi:hypothetical protein